MLNTGIRSRAALKKKNQRVMDNSPMLITIYKLNGQNFLQWLQSLIYVWGKGKSDYLTGATTPSDRNDP